jgi:hypothetical protein
MRDFRTQFAIDKRAALSAEDALKQSIQSGLDDDDIKDKAAWIAAQQKAYDNHVGRRVVAIRKGATEMALHDELIVRIAKNVITQGADPVFEKSAFKQAIDGRVFELYKVKPDAGDKVYPAAFTKCITTDPNGIALFKAMRFAKGHEVEPSPIPEVPKLSDLGPAHAKLEVLARDHKLANDRKTIEQARSYVYAHPDNVALREACKQEHFAAISKAA